MTKVTLDKNGFAKSAGTLKIYHYDAASGEFIGSSDDFLAQGVGIPANACIITPPTIEAGHVAVYRNGNWQADADHRGETVYAIADGAAIKVTEPGDYPAGTTTLKPATNFDKWDGTMWITDKDAEYQSRVSIFAAKKVALISEANSITQAWQTQLLLGIITDADKASLTAWMKYIQAIQAMNISDAPEIIWPQKPQ